MPSGSDFILDAAGDNTWECDGSLFCQSPNHADGCYSQSAYYQEEGRPGAFQSAGDTYPDWTDDRLFRIAYVADLLLDALDDNDFTEARQTLRTIHDLIVEDGRA